MVCAGGDASADMGHRPGRGARVGWRLPMPMSGTRLPCRAQAAARVAGHRVTGGQDSTNVLGCQIVGGVWRVAGGRLPGIFGSLRR